MTTFPLPTNRKMDTAQMANADELAALYDRDYFAWIERTLERLQQKDYSNIDWNNLVEEIADMGRSEKRRLTSNLVVLLQHLLKWQYQPNRRSRSWELSIDEHRRRIVEDLETSPSLKPFLVESFSKYYQHGVKQASIDTDLPKDTFPAECPYTIAQVLEEDFLPERS